jgi:peptide/nickel transport system ATP-binding protein
VSATDQGASTLIEVDGVSVDYWTEDHWTRVVDDVTLAVRPGEAMGLVGESGCGKTTTAYTLLGYSRPNSRVRSGQVRFEGVDLLQLPTRDLQRIRGRKISLVPQNPTTALSPGIRVGNQLVETLLDHDWCSTAREARQRTLDLFSLVSLPDPERIFQRYPHQLSGGQQQRVVIAMALACGPQLVVLDEPTTGLDVTTQAQILDLLMDLRSRLGMAMLYVTHNLGVVAQICDSICVMYAGRLVEIAPRRKLFLDPRHPYTQGLIASVPRIRTPSRRQPLLLKGLLRPSELPPGCRFAPRCEFALPSCFAEAQALRSSGAERFVACWRSQELPAYAERLARSAQPQVEPLEAEVLAERQPLLVVDGLRAGYTSARLRLGPQRKPKMVVEDVSFAIRPGETLALVGESGSGKTTVARALNGLLPSVQGKLAFDQAFDLKLPVDKRPDGLLRSIQLVFQNPDASLNPRQRVSEIIGRPLQKFYGVTGKEVRRGVEGLLEAVHLDASFYSRFPDELSGGERQRIAVARALAAEPKLLLCDEVLSALDVSVQANILQLLLDLQAERGIAYLFISHDLAVVRSLAHRVGVMYWGALCEIGDVEEVFGPPHHPYTYLLLRSVPEADPDQVIPPVRKDVGLVSGERRSACPFAARCPWKVGPICDEQAPPWQWTSATHGLSCHLPLEALQELQVK